MSSSAYLSFADRCEISEQVRFIQTIRKNKERVQVTFSLPKETIGQICWLWLCNHIAWTRRRKNQQTQDT
jgi:hypothetical protein